MKVALVHDYINEFGGAERVLLALSQLWPQAPIYTAFYSKGSPAWQRFKHHDIRVSWAHYLPFFSTFLYSPWRFLAPFIWGSFVRQLADYDLVISSASWYVTKGFGRRQSDGAAGREPIEICYCHTPPRWLYGYRTSIELQKYWPVKIYAAIVAHFMRLYDFNAAQRVDYFIANSKNVAGRINKFYRRQATVIYPPVDTAFSKLASRRTRLPRLTVASSVQLGNQKLNANNLDARRLSYYLVVSRIVGGKGLDLAVEAANKMGFPLKVVGKPAGYATQFRTIRKIARSNVEFLGFVDDSRLAQLYAGAKGFLALAEDEDFGITPVEAMLAGTPVIAYHGGGYLETVVDGKTGIFFSEPTVDALISTLRRFEKLKWDHKAIAKHAQKFSKERFNKEVKKFVEKAVGNDR